MRNQARRRPGQRLFFFDRGGGNERANNWCARAHPAWVHKIVQSFFESWIRSADAIGILNNRFAIGKQSRNRESHGDAMIAEARKTRSAQWGWSVNFQAIVELDHLRAHTTQIVGDGRDAISFLDAQFLGMT